MSSDRISDNHGTARWGESNVDPLADLEAAKRVLMGEPVEDDPTRIQLIAMSAPIKLYDFQQDMMDRLASAFGVPFDQFTGKTSTSRAEAEALVATYREKHGRIAELWDRTVLQTAVNNAAFFVSISLPKDVLRLWRWEVGRTITMRQFRRLRGRVKAGKPIPDAPMLTINFDIPTTRKLAPFVRPL